MKSLFKAVLVLLVMVTLVSLAVTIWLEKNRVQADNASLRKELEQKNQQAEVLHQANTEKKTQLQSLNNNIEAVVEEQARESFGMIEDGETFFYEKNTSKKVIKLPSPPPKIIQLESSIKSK